MHQNETFALTWTRTALTGRAREYVEQFLRDAPTAVGRWHLPYALTQQYSDSGGRAENSSVYGGGCIDYGAVGGSACEFGNPTGAGHAIPGTDARRTVTRSRP